MKRIHIPIPVCVALVLILSAAGLLAQAAEVERLNPIVFGQGEDKGV